MSVDVDRSRTAAATAARRRAHAAKLADQLGRRLGDLERDVLAALLLALVDEVEGRKRPR